MFSYGWLLGIFFVALLLEDVGFILLSKGMKATRMDSGTGVPGRMASIIRHPSVIVGVLLQAVYYILLLGVLRELPVSLVVPMTGFGYVLTAWLARLFLREQIPLLRWGGISLIMIGVVLIARSN
jgi:drug/metabolite transporter (DMT)-like permease